MMSTLEKVISLLLLVSVFKQVHMLKAYVQDVTRHFPYMNMNVLPAGHQQEKLILGGTRSIASHVITLAKIVTLQKFTVELNVMLAHVLQALQSSLKLAKHLV